MARIGRALTILFFFGALLASTGCTFRPLRLMIPDFAASQVQGIELWRLDDVTGNPQAAGKLVLVGVSTFDFGKGPIELMEYMIEKPDGSTSFPIYSEAIWGSANPEDLELRVFFLPSAPSGYFKISTYNPYGSSPLSAEQTYLL